MASSFRISISAKNAQRLRELLTKRAASGHSARDEAIWQQIRSRLLADPMEFGEPDFELRHLKLNMRTACLEPWTVHFGIDLLRHIVYIKSFLILGKHE